MAPASVDRFAADNNAFALAIYEHLRQGPGNLFFSPFSMRGALGMALAGARGDTAAQMRHVLRIVSIDEPVHAAVAPFVRGLSEAGSGDYELAVANSLWGQAGAPLEPGFLEVIMRHYGAGMNVVDFAGAAEDARAAINRWVEDATRQRIRALIPAGALDADTRLVLVNAVYFKGTWVLQFERALTRNEPFHVESGKNVQAALMHRRSEVWYAQAAGYQAVQLDYRGGSLCMLVFLPDRQDGLRDLEQVLSGSALRDTVSRMRPREVDLFLPRFRLTWGTFDVRDELAALGMPLAFSPLQADFSGINGRVPPHRDALFVSGVFHKAFVAVNEEGTEAAAATAALAPPMASPSHRAPTVPVFRADHPFVFAISDRKSGAILFYGRIVDPTLEG
jgi:serpin B